MGSSSNRAIAASYVERLSSWTGPANGWGSWTPWHGFVALPGGVTYSLAAGARVLAEIYYGTSDERVVDQGRLGLFFSDEPATTLSIPSDLVLEVRGEVPAGATMQRFRSEMPIDDGTRLLSLLPQLDPGIQSLEVSLRRPRWWHRDPLVCQGHPAGLADTLYLPRAGRRPARVAASCHRILRERLRQATTGWVQPDGQPVLAAEFPGRLRSFPRPVEGC